jgi:hypothetical protein
MKNNVHRCQLGIGLLLLLLGACTPLPTRNPTPVSSLSSPTVVEEVYQDDRLCFAVNVPADWQTDGVSGGFASFTPPNGQSSFRITNVALGTQPTLESALADLRRGALGSSMQEVKDTTVDGQQALWITLAPDAQFSFVVLLITPQCGDSHHALYISASRTDQAQFEAFLRRLRIA